MSMFFLCSLAVLFSIKSRVSIEKPQTNSFSGLCAPTQAKISSVRSRAIFISPSCFLTLSAATVAGVMMILNKTYGFVGEGALVAPQANAMAAVIKPLMEGGATPWMLYLAGAALALILTMIGVPALAFALGMFIPLELNTPLLVGGLISWYVASRSGSERGKKARRERGTLIASGFIAGGALMGVVSALLKYFGADWFASSWNATSGAEILAVVMYVAIIGYFIWDSLRAKPEAE